MARLLPSGNIHGEGARAIYPSDGYRADSANLGWSEHSRARAKGTSHVLKFSPSSPQMSGGTERREYVNGGKDKEP